MLSDVHYPGWKATVDGEDAEVERVNYVMRGGPAAPGRVTRWVRYEPLSWRIGWIVSLLSTVFQLAATAIAGSAAGEAEMKERARQPAQVSREREKSPSATLGQLRADGEPAAAPRPAPPPAPR